MTKCSLFASCCMLALGHVCNGQWDIPGAYSRPVYGTTGELQLLYPKAKPAAQTPALIQSMPIIDPPSAATPPLSAPTTMDELIDRLTAIRAQKAELVKMEHAAIVAIREKMRAQREKLNRLGAGDPPPEKK